MAGVLRQPLRCALASAGAAPPPTPFGLFSLGAGPAAGSIQRRSYAAPPRRKQMPRQGPGSAGAAPAVMMRQQMASERSPAMISFRIPMTFVSPPMAPYVKTPTVFAKLLWYRMRTHFTDWLSELAVRFQSKPTFFTAARFRPDKKAILPTAKTMHYQMLEATATADTATLARLLTKGHLDEVAGLLARRPRGRRCEWQLLAYHGRPRIVDSKTIMIPGPIPMYMRQVVVSIQSRQRFTWTDASGANTAAPVEKDVRENLVLVAMLDQVTWQTSEWRIFGFLPVTTLENWEKEKKLMEAANKEGLTLG